MNVPGTAVTGPLMLTGAGGDSPASVAVFTLLPPLPELAALEPNSGPQALEVKIRGARFTGATGLSFLDSGRVLAAPDVVNDGEIRFKWPLGEPSGRVAVIKGGETSAGLPFAVTAAYAPGVLNIVDFNPKMAEAGDDITIDCWNYVPGVTVEFAGLFGGVPADAVRATADPTRIVATVPALADEGAGRITLVPPAGGPGVDSPVDFTVLPPTPPVMAALEPAVGQAGIEVIIRGAHLKGARGLHFATSGGNLAVFTTVSDTELRFRWPGGEPSGLVSVEKAGARPGGLPFTVKRGKHLPDRLAMLPENLESARVAFGNRFGMHPILDYPERMRAAPYGYLCFPEAPIFHAFPPFPRAFGALRPGKDSGPVCTLDLLLPNVFYEALPEPVRAEVVRLGIDPRQVDIFVVSQDLPYANDLDYRFRPHYWAIPAAPYHGVYDVTQNVEARLFGGAVRFQGHPAIATVAAHVQLLCALPSAAGVPLPPPIAVMPLGGFLYTQAFPDNLPVAGINHMVSTAFWSVTRDGDHAAATLHWLLNDVDQQELEHLAGLLHTFRDLLVRVDGSGHLRHTRMHLLLRALMRPVITAVILDPPDHAGQCLVHLTGTAFTGAAQIQEDGGVAHPLHVVDDAHADATIPDPGAGPHNYIFATPIGGQGGGRF